MEKTESMQLEFSLNEAKNGLVVRSAKVDGEVVIPSTAEYEGKIYPVREIADDAFNSSYRMTKVIIPDSVVKIGRSAFQNCRLKEIAIPESVTTIGRGAFVCCHGLTKVVIPDSVAVIPDGLFSNCSGLLDVVIPNSVNRIGRRAFERCEKLTNVIIPDSTQTIGESAFEFCVSLVNVSIGNSVKEIGDSAFSGCNQITGSINLNSIEKIGNKAFFLCSSITNIHVGESVLEIGDRAFYGCRCIKEIALPDSITSIGKDALIFLPRKVRFICVNSYDKYKVGYITKDIEEFSPTYYRILGSSYWSVLDEKHIAYFDIEEEEPIQQLRKRIDLNMVTINGFDYPFSISKCKLSQEDYCVIMGVDHFYNEKVPVGADQPYVTNQWDQYVARYSRGQNWGEICEILKKLEEKTGRYFRLPTIKECEFVNEHKSEEVGFKLDNELCLAGSNYLCTEKKSIYVSDPKDSQDLPVYMSFRLVECEIPLSKIDYADKEVLRRIHESMDKEDEDMHYWWEN